MAIPCLLVVDDDPEMRDMMTAFLQKKGFMAFGAASAAEIAARMERTRIDLILLDVMLGDEDGIAICADLRAQAELPIIFVSALGADHHRMAGYEVGADDYVAKPFNPDLLLARIRAVLARAQRSASLSYRRRKGAYRFAGWRYDAARDELFSPAGIQVTLSRREADLLSVLLANPGIPLSREEISAAMDAEAASDAPGRAIDVLVGRLRQKIEAAPKAPELLRTARGTGYVLACEVTEESPCG